MKQLLLCLLLCSLLACEKGLSDAKSSFGSGKGGSLARFTIAGNYLYTVDQQNLSVFDVSNPAQPQFKRKVPVGFEIETIFPFNGRLFIGSTSVVHIFSLDDPANPQKLSEAISPQALRRCDPVVAKDTVAFATLRTNGPCGGTSSVLAVYDIRNITQPVQRATYELSEPYGLGYEGNTLYVCDKLGGLLLFDISDPYNPQLLKSVQDGAYVDVIPYGDVLLCWVQDGILFYDISDNQNPVLLTKIN